MAYNFHQELVYLGTQTASAAASVSFTTGISSNFVNYLVKIRDITTSIPNNGILLTFSTNGGSSYLATNYKANIAMNGTALDNDSSTTSIFVDVDETGTSTNQGNADVVMYNLSNSQVKTVYTFGGAFQNFSSIVATRNGVGVQTGTTAVNAIKFAGNGGANMTAKFYLYGIQEP